MKAFWYYLVAIILLCLGANVLGDCPSSNTPAAGSKYTISVTSVSGVRSSKVVLPTGYKNNVARPLFLVLHPLNFNNLYIESLTDFDEVANQENVIVTYPQGFNNSWNGGSCCPSSWYLDDNVEDVQFLEDLLDKLTTDLCIDTNNIFVTGMSNGAFMAFRLMCEFPTKFRAAGTVAGVTAQYTLTDTIFTCPASVTIPLFHIHGTSDPAVPYNGNPLLKWPSVPDNMKDWANKNGCTPGTTTTTFVNGTYTCISYGCPSVTNVTLCTGTGEGHIWPGGESTTDIKATAEITNFFRKYYNASPSPSPSPLPPSPSRSASPAVPSPSQSPSQSANPSEGASPSQSPNHSQGTSPSALPLNFGTSLVPRMLVIAAAFAVQLL